MLDDKKDVQEMSKSQLEEYVKNYKIFIDTCSLIHPGADQFWMNIIPLLKQYGNKVIIPFRVIEELNKLSQKPEKQDVATACKNTLKVLYQLNNAGFIDIRGEKSDSFSDNVFQVVFTKFRMTHNLLLITQDNGLAKDILNLNNSESVNAKPVSARRLNKYGFLSNYKWNTPSSNNESNGKSKNNDTVPEEEKFRICHSIRQFTDENMHVRQVPKEHEIVYVNQSEIQLTEQIGSGGEGYIYKTNTPYVAKIYKEDKLKKSKYEKIKLMLSKPIKCEGICYPVAMLQNRYGEFVGYLMPCAKGKELQKSIFIKPLFLKYFPGWKKRDTVELCITILKKIKYLHDRNIIMGDINPCNILVVSPEEVYFVDTDSYQIEDLPCPVGTVNYTAPEIQTYNYADFLRTMGNENFAVATLMFMIMLPGKPPYSQQGGEDPKANIINMDFSYPFGENSNKKTPDGPWRFIWSHLTYDLKEAFYNTFRKDGENSKENTRLSVEEWLSLFNYYLQLLDSGKFGEQDKMSEDLFPVRHKKNPKLNYVKCVLCQNEVAENQCKNGMCRSCLNDKGEVYQCKKCGKEIIYTNYQKYIKRAPKYDICKECFELNNQVKLRPVCVGCGKTFEITNGDYDFYIKKGFDIPKRCPTCRANKKSSSSNFNPYSVPTPSPSTTPATKRKGSICFITTAVCEYLGKPDDCDELNKLRNFRDTWLCCQPDGPALIAEYYNKAPLIVSMMKASPRYNEYCQYLWDHYIKKCIEMIDNGKLESCKNLYCEMVYYTEKITRPDK